MTALYGDDGEIKNDAAWEDHLKKLGLSKPSKMNFPWRRTDPNPLPPWVIAPKRGSVSVWKDITDADVAQQAQRDPPTPGMNEMQRAAFKFFQRSCIKYDPVGSQVTCNPPPQTNTDYDFLALTDDMKMAEELLAQAGFKRDGVNYEGQDFHSWRFGGKADINNKSINVILTDNKDFHEKFLIATALAKRLNVLDKQDRIALFDAVRGTAPTPEINLEIDVPF